MVFIWMILKVLIFALCAGVAISVIVFVPMTLYVIPYTLWVGKQNLDGMQLDKKKESNLQAVKNATKFYKAKLSGKEPIF